jgi:hypothetical protein
MVHSDRCLSIKAVAVQLNSDKGSYVHRKRLNYDPCDWILHHDNAPANKELSFKHFLAQKSITEMEHQPCFSDLALSGFWLFPEMKSTLK